MTFIQCQESDKLSIIDKDLLILKHKRSKRIVTGMIEGAIAKNLTYIIFKPLMFIDKVYSVSDNDG